MRMIDQINTVNINLRRVKVFISNLHADVRAAKRLIEMWQVNINMFFRVSGIECYLLKCRVGVPSYYLTVKSRWSALVDNFQSVLPLQKDVRMIQTDHVRRFMMTPNIIHPY